MQQKLGSSLLLTLGMLALLTMASASAAVEVHGLLKWGVDAGGDTLPSSRLAFTDGSSSAIKANEGFYIGGGVALVEAAQDIDVEFTLAWKWAYVTADNGNITFTRVPLETLVFYKFKNIRLGGGLAYHINPQVQSDFGSGTSFDNAFGGIVQADYRITEKINLGLRYTSVDYKTANSPAAKGNGAGISFSGRF